jgi:Mrp family chromosome partitioning ATPase
MSISDQAFIRAYHEDATTIVIAPSGGYEAAAASPVPAPHAKFGAAPTKTAQKPISQPELTASSADPVAKPRAAKTEPARSATSPHVFSVTSDESLAQTLRVPLSVLRSSTTAVSRVTMPKPILEIDAVHWPATCEALLSQHGEHFDRLAVEICREASLGNKITAITGLRRSEGRTTLALCLAHRLAAGRAKVALVDADFSNPSLAAQLKIDVDQGWETVLDDTETLWDVMIESLADRIALLPLSGATNHSESPAAFRISSILGELAEHYDTVLVDAGPISADSVTNQWLLEPETAVHNVILSHDVRHTQPHELAAGCVQLAEAKLRQLGIAAMFVPDEPGIRTATKR